MPSDNIKMIELKDKINTICQVSRYPTPIHFNLPSHRQRIPVILIGKVIFTAQNWLVDDKQRSIRLCQQVVSMLEDNKFVLEHIDKLQSEAVSFEKAFTDDEINITVSIYA